MAFTTEDRQDVIALAVAVWDAAPGKSNLEELATQFNAGATINSILDGLVESEIFQNEYPAFLTNEEFATEFVGRVVGGQVSEADEQWAVDQITSQLNAGASQSQVILGAIQALRAVPETDAKWGNAAAAFNNKIEVAEFHTVTMEQDADTVEGLQAVLEGVDESDDSVDLAKGRINNEAPEVDADQSFDVSEDAAKDAVIGTVSASDPDGDALSFAITSGNDDGFFAIDSETGEITLADPSVDVKPADSPLTVELGVTATDERGLKSEQTVTVNVNAVNQEPVAADDEVTTDEDTAVTIDVLDNDSDEDGDSLSVSITSGPSNGEATVNEDGQVEYTPNADFNGSDSITYQVDDGQGGTDTATVDLTVNPIADLSIADASVTEGDSGTTAMTFTVNLDEAVDEDITVDFATSDGTAVSSGANQDFVANSGTVTIAAGDTSGTFDVNVIGDELIEGDETFTVDLSNASGDASLAEATATGTIEDNESATLSVDDVSMAEGDADTQTYTFTVSLDQAAENDVTFDIATADDTATAGEDYVANSESLTIAAGDTSATFDVTVNGDETIETDEAFNVELSNIVGADAGSNGTGTIENDDGVGISISDADAVEEGNSATFTISLTQASDEDITVKVASSSGSATEGDDFTAVDQTVTISAGDTSADVTVDTTDDADVEDEEDFTLTLSDADGATIIEGEGEATGTITDNDVDGESFTLTDGSDEFTPTASGDDQTTSANDTFTAKVISDGDGDLQQTLQSVDILDGGDGDDRLDAVLTGGGTTSASISNIEQLFFRSTDTANTINANNIEGVNKLVSDRSSVNLTVNNVSEEMAFELNDTNNDLIVSYADDALGSATSSQDVTLKGGVDALLSLDITGGSDVVTTLDIDNSGTSSLDLTGLNNQADKFTTFNVSGSGDLTIAETTTAFDGLATVDAESFSGDLTIDLSASSQAVTLTSGNGDDTVTGSGQDDELTTGAGDDTITAGAGAVTIDAGAGSDTIDITGGGNDTVDAGAGDDEVSAGTALDSNDELDGGDGTDTLKITNTIGASLDLTSFERLELTTDGAGDTDTADLDNLGLNVERVTIISANDADGIELDNVESEELVLTNSDGIQFGTLDIDLKDASGGSDSIDLTINNKDTDATMTVAHVDATDIETANLTVSGNDVDIQQVTGAGTLNIDGSVDVALGGGTALTNTTINAADVTGDVTLTLGAADQTITGGTGDDEFNFSDNANADDTVDGGDGDDTVNLVASTATSLDAVAPVTSNVETVALAATFAAGGVEAVTLDASSLAGVDTLEVTATTENTNADTLTVNKLDSEVGTVVLGGDFDNQTTVTLNLDDDSGDSDVLDIKLDADAATQTIDKLTTSDIETLNLDVSDGDTDADSTTTVTDLDITGAETLDIGGTDSLIVSGFSNGGSVTSVDLTDLDGGFDLADIGNGATFTLDEIGDGVSGNNIDTDLDGTDDDAFSVLNLNSGEKDTVEFNDLSNSIVIKGAEGGGDISDDTFDFSALADSFDDLTFTDGDWQNGGATDVKIEVDGQDGAVYMIGVTSSDLNQADFTFS